LKTSRYIKSSTPIFLSNCNPSRYSRNVAILAPDFLSLSL